VSTGAVTSPDSIGLAIVNVWNSQLTALSIPICQLLIIYHKRDVAGSRQLEHLLDGIDVLLQILEDATFLKMVVTTGAALPAREWVFALHGCPFLSPTTVAGKKTAACSSFAMARNLQSALSSRMDHEALYICRLARWNAAANHLAAAWVRCSR
jgi:hypothetical protein